MTSLLSDYDYLLPEQLIAQCPVKPRDHARLLDTSAGTCHDRHIYDLPDMLDDGDVLVVNNTHVIPAQLIGRKGEGRIRFTLHQRSGANSWKAFAKPAKKCTPGTVITFGSDLQATVTHKADNGEVSLEFSASGDELDKAISEVGQMPLPPYIKRPDGAREDDRLDYQTLFAARSGAVAAPTAGLHFTHDLIERLTLKGVKICVVTLHVGAGTFLPVKVENIADHKMHSEWGEVTEEAVRMIAEAKQRGRRVISVGTTSLRILESAFRAHGRLAAFAGETDIFITPGFEFGVADHLLTNFHLPKSTLLMLVSAFSGYDFIRDVYHHAVREEYRFFSYGDACLLSCTALADTDLNSEG